MIGIQAIVGTVWWLVQMFVFVKNVPADSLVSVDEKELVLPV